MDRSHPDAPSPNETLASPSEAAVPTPGAQAGLQAVLAKIAGSPHELEEILGASPEALVAFDPNRRILLANRAAQELFGYGTGSLDGLSTDILLPERLRQPKAPPMVATEGVMQVDLPGRRRDGTEFPIEWAYGSVPVPSGAIFVMMVRDRTEVDRALDALRASEERFRLLVDGVRDYAIFMLDADGRVSSWNKGAERTKGWRAEEIVGQPYEAFFTSEDRVAGTPQRLLAATIREGSQEVSGWRVRKDGTRFFASAYLTALRTPEGELRGFAKITRDLTERLQAEEYERRLIEERAGREAAEAAEQRVRASEERLGRLQRMTAALSEAATPQDVAAVVLDQSLQALEAAGGAIYVVSADGTKLQLLDQRGHPARAQAENQTLPLEGRSPLTDAARDRTPGFYESFEECAALYPRLREAIRSGDFEASAALPLLTHGRLLGVLGIGFRQPRIFHEVDRSLLFTLSELCAQALERARLFAAESEARADAESASRSKDEFLAMLGHELRNPLAPIITALQLMKLRGGDALQKERTVIERQIAHLTRLVDDLLDVSRITQGKVELKKERVEIAEVVAQAIELASPLLEQRQHYLSLSVPASGLAVQGDATRLAQVVSNLLTNSAKYTQPGGHIEIAASRRLERIVLTVRDDGMGIAPAMLPRVFNLFAQERQSIDRSQGGLGLGLAIVKSLVAVHDGTVSAFSEGHGSGSVFTVELPSAPRQDPAGLAEPLPKALHAAQRGRRVLVVDDNLDAANLLAEVLRASGHLTEVAPDGPAALQLAGTFHPEIAVLDIGLPVMDGYELARRLRSQLGAVWLIAVTGYGQPADRDRARHAGFDAHLVKPVHLDALHAALGRAGSATNPD
jgi:PAS domain S-box-containing protein